MNAAPALEIIGVATVCALAVGACGLLASWLLRRRSIRWQVAVVAVVAVAAPYAGLIAVTQKMFISGHDLEVATFVGSAGAVVALLVALLLGSAIGRWSGTLRDQVRRMGDDEQERLEPSGPAEFRHLAEELRDARAKLAESTERERRLDRSRRDLVAWVSHDLRTPLAGLRAMTEALEDNMVDDPGRYHRQIRSDVERMTAMVDDLFELSRIRSGAVQPTLESVMLRDLVSEALASADPVARTRNIRLGGHVDDEIRVTADPAALSRAISNLVMNAIRHTPVDGAVEVLGRSVHDGVELSVIDQCGGIAEEDLDRVFEIGWQASVARTPDSQSVGRAGLGLSIVRGIVEAHSGEVFVENLTAATGCRFLIRLPRELLT